ncbi:ABC transporter permease subunit [Candidatus Nitrotoga sp. 1052]|uniref:ABC transporter permease subunit n=1 Tax=Candidatus Nitrotoga sp. 1052 TaxID=2886964 RepID=UPI001EF61FAC|nr:ABC transporter permease subunit [Candidatus Nitrotoga sp. 1052]CAH1080689.1 ABC-2 type transport system permease protein [Candidatus Nitrotoga sp. 1052]
MILTIAHKEFRSLFVIPSTWLILGALQFIFAWFFLARLDAFLQVQSQLAQLANAPGATLAVAAPLFGTIALILMMLIPIFTMRLIAEERRNQTLTLLMSAPVSDYHIVVGKFIGLMLFLLLIIASCMLMVLTLAAGTQLDAGLLLTNALGLVLLAASYVALGLYISSLTAQPVVAAIGALAIFFGLWLVEVSAVDNDNTWRALAPTSHFQSFNIGLLNSTDLMFFLLFCTAFLLLTIRRLHNNRIYS